MAPHSSTFAWKIPWTEEPGRLQSMGSLRVEDDWATSLSLLTFMHWRRKWQPTPVFLPGESQGWGSLVGCRLWGHTELDTAEVTQQQQQVIKSQKNKRLTWCNLSNSFVKIPEMIHKRPTTGNSAGNSGGKKILFAALKDKCTVVSLAMGWETHSRALCAVNSKLKQQG